MGSNELEHLRTMLHKRLERIMREETVSIEDVLSGFTPCPDSTDMATQESDRAYILLMRERNLKHARQIQEALHRMAEGTYGVCDECGEEIGLPRLKAQPMATLCVVCKNYYEKVPISSGY
jgi:DnaK suppressor protein